MSEQMLIIPGKSSNANIIQKHVFCTAKSLDFSFVLQHVTRVDYDLRDIDTGVHADHLIQV